MTPIPVPTGSYTPAFQPGVSILENGTVVGPVADDYCLTLDSAVKLAQLDALRPLIAGISMGPPFFMVPGTPFAPSTLVPWFVFLNGAAENAALIAQYFTEGELWENEIAGALNEIHGTMTAYASGQYQEPPYLVPVPGMWPVPAPPVPVNTPPAPAPTPTNPLGPPNGVGGFANAVWNNPPKLREYTDSQGHEYVLDSGMNIFGMSYWWIPVPAAQPAPLTNASPAPEPQAPLTPIPPVVFTGPATPEA